MRESKKACHSSSLRREWCAWPARSVVFIAIDVLNLDENSVVFGAGVIFKDANIIFSINHFPSHRL